ncbi:MAG: 4-hydroxythreonine-4-phosphate dehydrogenase PdxA [Deltaproteobacteria bacterium]|nr:4-hydroxythreonine-4-phosphate dehydrogenase PdxA [Deltaproteobacteria bacterium]
MEAPIVAITMGDPVGVGPEILCAALGANRIQPLCRPLVAGDPAVMERTAANLGHGLSFRSVKGPEQARFEPGVIDVAALSSLDPDALSPGRPTVETGRAMVAYVETAIRWGMEKKVHALATGPINKAAMHKAGYDYNGHTEILAKLTSTADYRMMLAGDRLRVVLVTIHTALSNVPALVTQKAVADTIAITGKSLVERFGIPAPKIAVAGLNPHAGEEGLFGDEEITAISPAVEQARAQGWDVQGPLPPDTLFVRAQTGHWDAVVCMYHDQGLIPFKMIHFEDGVNTTLGLPIIRTSVDHGTAYDLAGTGRASHQSLVAAVAMAALQARTLFGLP